VLADSSNADVYKPSRSGIDHVVAETIRWFQSDDTLAWVSVREFPRVGRGGVTAFTAEEGGISECR
jgi:hypothetical protein